MSQPTESEIKRWAMDAADWLWGTAQGAWNEKQTTSQIIVDAVIGMIPLVGDATAARDLIAVSTHLAEDEKKREEVGEWILLVVLLFALIPVVGGVIKGIGRLLIKAGKEIAKDTNLINDVIAVLNRFGHGDAVKFLRELDLLKYQQELIDKFKTFIDTITDALRKIKSQLGGFLSDGIKNTIDLWLTRFEQLKQAGSKMIPQALKDLNNKLKELQKAVYEGEIRKTTSGGKSVTREEEAKLVECAPIPKKKIKYWAKNEFETYEKLIADKVKEGWPDIRKSELLPGSMKKRYPHVEAFSGEIIADTIKGPKTIYRVLKPGRNRKESPWWLETMPANAQEWRENLAVLDDFNINNFFIKYEIPAGTELKVWKGRASEQFDAETGQHLPGGDFQIFVGFSKEISSQIGKLPALSTGWGTTTKRYGYDDTQSIVREVTTKSMTTVEREKKN